MADKDVKKAVKSEAEEFIERKLKAVNEMESPAKAKKAAERILKNRKVGK